MKKHGVHAVELLLPGDRLVDGWVVDDCTGDGDSCIVTVRHPDEPEPKTYRMPRKLEVEVNR